MFTSNNARWTHLIRKWNLNTKETDDGGGSPVDGAPVDHAEYCKALEIVESALKYTVLTFGRTFNSNNKRNVLQRLKDFIHNMRPAIEGQTNSS